MKMSEMQLDMLALSAELDLTLQIISTNVD